VPLERLSTPQEQGEGRLAAVLTLRDGHLVEFDVVHHRPDLPVLQHGVSRHLTEVHHPSQELGVGGGLRDFLQALILQGDSGHHKTIWQLLV